MNIFDVLETNLEPVFNHREYENLEPRQTRQILTRLRLLKETPLNKVNCDQCEKNCRGEPITIIKGKPYLICPDRFLEEPQLLAPSETRGWQFDFSRLSGLICNKSKLNTLRDLHITDKSANAIASGIIDKQNMLVVYYRGLRNEDFIGRVNFLYQSLNVRVLVIITPSLEVFEKNKGEVLEDNHIYLVALKALLENDFDLTSLVKSRLFGEKPAEPGHYCYIITNEHLLPRQAYRDEKQYQKLVKDYTKFDLFIDGFTKVVWENKRKAELTDGELSMMKDYIETRQALAPFQTSEYEGAYRGLEAEEAQARMRLKQLAEAGTLESDEVIKTDSAMRNAQDLLKQLEDRALKIFDKARQKIDIKSKGNYCYFKLIQRGGKERPTKYQFCPSEDLTYCLIVPV